MKRFFQRRVKQVVGEEFTIQTHLTINGVEEYHEFTGRAPIGVKAEDWEQVILARVYDQEPNSNILQDTHEAQIVRLNSRALGAMDLPKKLAYMRSRPLPQ